MKKLLFVPILLICNTLNAACDNGEVYPDKMFPEVIIHTTMGDITVELDRNRSPITVNNFLKYVKNKSYNNTLIHRVEKNFVIQGGGYNKDYDEIPQCGKIFNESGNGLRNTKGSIAMARYADPHSATSQFYFNLSDSPNLDPNPKNWGYTVFGQVIEGIDILEAIADVGVGYSEKLDADNVPIEPLFIKSVEVN